MGAQQLALNIDRALTKPVPLAVRARVSEAIGTVIKVAGLNARIGELCELRSPDTDDVLFAEVVGFVKQTALLVPFGSTRGVSTATQVIATGRTHSIVVGNALRGRVLDGFGAPLDGKGALLDTQQVPVHAEAPAALQRRMIARTFATGIRVVDAAGRPSGNQRTG